MGMRSGCVVSAAREGGRSSDVSGRRGQLIGGKQATGAGPCLI